jgi:hypothetical protein
MEPSDMPRKIDPKTARAYEAAGWEVNSSGRAVAPIRQLSPSYVPPRGFSRLPEPRSRWRDDRPQPEVPLRISSITEVSERLRPLYADDRGGYVRGPHGDVLSSYRLAKAKDPLAAPITVRRTMTQAQWLTLLSVAERQEREHFTRDLACGRIQIKE